jgi:uncharacterized membrane protein
MPGLLVGAGVVLIASAIAGWLGRLPPNGIVGIRTSTTRATPEGWYAAHRASAIAIGAAGAALVCGAVVRLLVNSDSSVIIAMVAALVLVCVGTVQAQRAARSRQPQ